MSERIWDPFLTEQDRAHLAMTKHKRVGFGNRPALLLVDLYRWVFGDKPEPLLEAVKTWPGSCGLAGWNALPHIQRLLGIARETRIPIIHVTGLDGSGIEDWHARHDTSREMVTGPQVEERRKHRYDIVDEVTPIPGEVFLRKTASSPFWGTPIVFHLIRRQIDTLIICGESTSGCVRATVVDACTNRYRVIIPEECVFDRHEATHAINLFDMNQKYGDVIPLDEAIQHLQATQIEKRGETYETVQLV